MNKIKLLIITFTFVLPLFGQYSFDFTCVSDTFQTGTDYFAYYFRLTNTGTLPDTYAFDCRVIDSVPGWFEIYCAGGQCAEPGIILYDYLTPGAVDTGIDISVYTAQNVWGTEKINLLVWSLHNPGLRDSINVYAAMEQSVNETERIILHQNQPKLEIYPNPFKNHLQIKYQIGKVDQNFLQGSMVLSKPEVNLAIYDVSGRMIKKFNHLTNYQFNEIRWPGDDDSGNILPDGVYIICVEANGIKTNKVVVKLK
uniref:T9SS type A sorting domain-containing protein n=1 Tax=candidate division WOR-3 bacterium TaxID=2052148 RepID=A0A7V1EHR8_UNCW3